MELSSATKDVLHDWAHRLARRQYAWLLILLVGIATFLPNLGSHGLWDVDEAHNAECAREMLEAGTWIVPTFNYQLRTDKPAMLYWWIMGSYQVFGVSEWSARLPSVLAGLCSLLLTYEIGRRLFGSVTGLLSALILCSSFMFAVSSHAVTPDALLICYVQATFLTWLVAYDRKQPAWLLLAGVFSGCAVLTKGPVGVALPMLVVGLHLLWQRDLSFLWQRRTVQSAIICLAVILPWYILVGVETHGEFLKGFFLTHNLSRFSVPMEGHTGPIVYHFLVILVAFAPWSIFLGPTFWFNIRGEQTDDRVSSIRFLLCWVAVWFVVFSIAATKLPNYVLPTYPPLAMMTAAFLVRWWKQSSNELSWRVPVWVWRLSLICFVLIGVGLLVGLPIVAGWISLEALAGRTLPGAVWLLPVALVPIAIGMLCWKRWSQRQIGYGVALLMVGCVVLTAGISAFGPVAADQERAIKPLALMISGAAGNNDVRIGTHPRYYRPSLVFYLQREVVRCSSDEKAVELLKTRVPTYMLVPAKEWPALLAQTGGQLTIVDQKHDFTVGQEILLISNQGTQQTKVDLPRQ